MPTPAHRAIAELVAAGFIRVIVTTNFDRLFESAVREAGVEPVVISSPAAAVGATPLTHSRCTIIKVHGDYLDPDLKNTVAELSSYDPAIDERLGQVFDEYGLVVCGWSAEWDDALRAALLREPSRRYGTYWTHLGTLGQGAQQLVVHRAAVEVPIVDADDFFATLAARVTTLAESMDGRPLSTALAIAEVKRYLPDPVHRIRLHDLVMGEAEHALALPQLDPNQGPTIEPVLVAMHKFEAAVATLLTVAATMAFFADKAEHDTLLVDVVRRLSRRYRLTGGTNVWINLELYPAFLVLYAAGLGALARGRLDPFAQMLTGIEVPSWSGTKEPLVAASRSPLNDQVCNYAVTEPGQSRRTPVSDYLHRVLRDPLREIVRSDEEYSSHFNELEYLLGSPARRGTAGGLSVASSGRTAKLMLPKSVTISWSVTARPSTLQASSIPRQEPSPWLRPRSSTEKSSHVAGSAGRPTQPEDYEWPVR